MTGGMRKIEPRHGRAGPHRIALGQLDAGSFLNVHQFPQRCLLRVIGLRGIAGRRPDALIFFGNQLLVRQRLAAGIAPELAAHPRVQMLGKGFRQAVGQRLHHDAPVVVCLLKIFLKRRFLANPRRHRKRADVIGKPAVARCNEVRQRRVRTLFATRSLVLARNLLPQRMHADQLRFARGVLEQHDILANAVRRPEPDHRAGRQPILLDDAAQHVLGVLEQLGGLNANHLVLKYRRIAA